MAFPTLNPALARSLATRGYDTPTAVQLAVLDGGATGRDMLVSAQTGSGKTVAFGVAIGDTLLGDRERLPAASAPLALIIAPTRELALQVSRELAWLYEAAGARVATCVGGMDPRAEGRQLDAGAHIVVGTPGRLRDHLERRRLNLEGLRAVVLDEADEMLDLGFREDLEFILDATPAERRTLLFSATMPREIETLARRYQRDSVRIETGRRDQQHADIAYVAHRCVPADVESTIVNVLRFHEARAALVFCATREAVNRLTARLAERGFSAVALSGELTQAERTKALQALRDGRARVLVATDVAARGLDLPDLHLVIHADLPNDGETLLHRSGRTGRAGRKGLCVLVVPFNRRRKADSVIGAARITPTWQPAPTPEDVRNRDQERFLAEPGFTTPATDDEAQRVAMLQAARSAEEIALALVRLHSARLPPAEELTVDVGPTQRREKRPSWDEDRRSHTNTAARPERAWQGDEQRRQAPASRHRRADERPMTWFRINIGRNRHGDPRWLLPLICKAGGVSKAEIGAIRVDELETRFEILTEVADQFETQARTAKEKDGQIVRAEGASFGRDAAEPRGNDTADAPGESRPRREHAPRADQKKQKGHKVAWRVGGKPKPSGGGAPLRRHAKAHGAARPTGSAAAMADGSNARPATPHGKKKKKARTAALAGGE